MIFVIIFFILPLIEISLFIKIGALLGLWETLLICLLTAMIGGYLFRSQGLYKLRDLQRAVDHGRMPLQEIFDGVCILIAGALLITPGFATDIIGFSLFVPPVRKVLAQQLAKHKNIDVRYNTGPTASQGSHTSYTHNPDHPIDVEVEHVDDEDISHKP